MKKNVKSGKTGSALARSAEYEMIKRRAHLSSERFLYLLFAVVYHWRSVRGADCCEAYLNHCVVHVLILLSYSDFCLIFIRQRSALPTKKSSFMYLSLSFQFIL